MQGERKTDRKRETKKKKKRFSLGSSARRETATRFAYSLRFMESVQIKKNL
jgi:hypothetical protein